MLKEQMYFEDTIFRFIYSFHMPCLMLLSGYFYGYTIKKKDLCLNRIKMVLIPAIAWSSIPVGLDLSKAIIKNQLNNKVLLNCLEVLVTEYWFLWAILFGSLMVWIVHFCFRDSVVVFIIIGAALLFLPDWLNMNMYVFMYPYFVVGYLWNVKAAGDADVIKRLCCNKGIVMVVLITAFAVLFLFYRTSSFVYTSGTMVRDFSQLVTDLYRFLMGFAGSAMVIWLVFICHPMIEKRMNVLHKVLAYCGRASLAIYTIDSLLNREILWRLTRNFKLNYGIAIIETVVVITFCTGIDQIIKKMPVARKVLLGSR